MLQADSAAALCPGVSNTIRKMKNMNINKQILAVGGSDILFGPFSSASFVMFVPTDAAWAAAFKTLSAPRSSDPKPWAVYTDPKAYAVG